MHLALLFEMPQRPQSSFTADCDMDISEALFDSEDRMHPLRRDQALQHSQVTFDLEASDPDNSAIIADAQRISHFRKMAKSGGGFPGMSLSPRLLR